jgi:hypothetical protein
MKEKSYDYLIEMDQLGDKLIDESSLFYGQVEGQSD